MTTKNHASAPLSVALIPTLIASLGSSAAVSTGVAVISATTLSGCDVCWAAEDRQDCLDYNYYDVYLRHEQPSVAIVDDAAVIVYRAYESVGSVSEIKVASVDLGSDITNPAAALRGRIALGCDPGQGQ